MGHSTKCATRSGWYATACDCGLLEPKTPPMDRVEENVRGRIREIEEELAATYMLIGEATVNGKDATDWVSNAKEKRGRIWELKYVLNMIGG